MTTDVVDGDVVVVTGALQELGLVHDVVVRKVGSENIEGLHRSKTWRQEEPQSILLCSFAPHSPLSSFSSFSVAFFLRRVPALRDDKPVSNPARDAF
jgi:hypothetical protein